MAQSPHTIGRFQILRQQQGAGPGGDLYLAYDPRTSVTVSVRVLAIRAPSWPDVLRDQLPRLVSFSNPAVVPVLEFGLDEASVWIASGYLGDTTLADLIARGPDVPLARKLTIVSGLCTGLAAALEHGITILDVSPPALWMSDGGATVRLGGFELPGDRTRLVTEGRPTTAAYLSPEQIERSDADRMASAIFRAGIVLYELVAKTHPFEGANAADAIDRIRFSDPPPLASGIDSTAGLDTVLRRALAKSPADRFRSLRTFADELNRLAALASASDVEKQEDIVPTTERTAVRPMVNRQRPESAPPAAEARAVDSPALVHDENVQFTVFQPKALAPGAWHTMLVFAHLAEARPDAPPDEPDPVEEVQRQARAILGDLKASGRQTVDSLQAVPREGELTFLPRAEGVEFNPPSRQFTWTESVHREEFRLRAGPDRSGTLVRGRLSVFLGCVLLAEIPLALRIGAGGKPAVDDVVRQAARPYRRIFASYSHLDTPIVNEFAEYAKAMGDRYQLDVIDLRSGERWVPALQGLIRDADVFQLFWSWNALRSPYVRDEWEFAMGLHRPSFVRPVYWEEPMPRDGDLPPAALLDLHFEPIRPRSVPKAAVKRSDHRRVPPPAPPAPKPLPQDLRASTTDTAFDVPAPAVSSAPVAPRSTDAPARPSVAAKPSKPEVERTVSIDQAAEPHPSSDALPQVRIPAPHAPVGAPPVRPAPPATAPPASRPRPVPPPQHAPRPSPKAPSARPPVWRIVAPAMAALLLLVIAPTLMLTWGTRSPDDPNPPKPATESIIVEVTDRAGRSVSGVVVTLDSGTASFNGVTDASGRATLELPIATAPREYSVIVEAKTGIPGGLPGVTKSGKVIQTVINPKQPVVRIQLSD